jgi:hypothetical protein
MPDHDDEPICGCCGCEEAAHGCLGEDEDDPDNDCTGYGACPGFVDGDES